MIQEQAESFAETATHPEPVSPLSNLRSNGQPVVVQLVSDRHSTTSQDLSQKQFAEDLDSFQSSLSLSLGLRPQAKSKKASSFVGQGLSDALPETDSFRKKASLSFVPQSFQNLWNQSSLKNLYDSQKRSSNNRASNEESKD